MNTSNNLDHIMNSAFTGTNTVKTKVKAPTTASRLGYAMRPFNNLVTLTLVSVLGYIGVFLGTVLGLVYGILALVPAGPFIVQNIPVGVTLIVLSVCGLMAIGGIIAGILAGLLISTPYAMYCNM